MTEQEQEIAIREFCGWRYGEVPKTKWFPDGGTGWISPKGALSVPPSYLHDLNAAMTICSFLTKQGWACVANMGKDSTWECFFTKHPEKCLTLPGLGEPYGAGKTLSQAISEATLRLIGKWKD